MLQRAALGKHQSQPRPLTLNWYVGSFFTPGLDGFSEWRGDAFWAIFFGACFFLRERRKIRHYMHIAHTPQYQTLCTQFCTFFPRLQWRGLPGSM